MDKNQSSVDKNQSNPWGQDNSADAQQLAWTTPSSPAERERVPRVLVSEALDGPVLVNGSTPPTRDSEDNTELHAIIGPGTSFHGTLSFAGRVRIDGEFAGQILGGNLVIVGEGARVQGEIRARRVIILGGNVKADIIASEGIELYVPAQVAGDLRAPEIHLDRGVKFQGTCDLSEPAQF